jgi:DNA-binding response OmpR family regulator
MTDPRHVLLVEDDPLLSELLEMLLLLEGLGVAHAENGLDALQRLKDGQFGLIVLDLMMPLMDGLRFLEEFSAIPSEKPPVLVLSGSSDLAAAERARSCGAAAVAHKPVDQDEFLALVRSLLERPTEAAAS